MTIQISAPIRVTRWLGHRLPFKGKDRIIRALCHPDDFWKTMGVPTGNILYIPREKIITMNLRYPLKSPKRIGVETAAGEVSKALDVQTQIAAAVTAQLGDMQVRVEPMNNAEILKAQGFIELKMRELWVSRERRMAFSQEAIEDHNLEWLESKLAREVPEGEFRFHFNSPANRDECVKVLAELKLEHLVPVSSSGF